MLEQGFEEIQKITDSRHTEKIKRLSEKNEKIYTALFEEGVRNGEVVDYNTELLSMILQGIYKSVSASYIANQMEAVDLAKFIVDIFFEGVKNKEKIHTKSHENKTYTDAFYQKLLNKYISVETQNKEIFKGILTSIDKQQLQIAIVKTDGKKVDLKNISFVAYIAKSEVKQIDETK